MAKYGVTHSCGHEVVHQIYGPHKGRDSKVEWLSSRPCTDCWRKEQDEQRAAASAKAAEANQAKGLPALTGSAKQIAWAESIRASAIAKLGDLPALALDRLSEQAAGELRDALILLQSEITDQAEAKWWIDNRDETVVREPAYWVRRQLKDRLDVLAPTAKAEMAAHEASRQPQA